MLPQHLSELVVMPQEVINFFESGGFVCSVSGRYMQSVALDEMLVNKDLKPTVVRPSKEYFLARRILKVATSPHCEVADHRLCA